MNFLQDDQVAIAYSDIGGMLEQVDSLFAGNDKENIHCLALVVENTVAHALLVLYLLSKKLNFMLLNGHVPVDDKIPFFCDVIVTVAAGTTDWPGNIRLTRNPGYRQGKSALQRHSGMVLFLSSGTSGQPKYVCYKQEDLLRNAGNCVKRFAMDHRSKVLVPVPVNHMYGMGVGLLPALLSGAGVCLINKNNVIKLLDRMTAIRPDVTLLTPAVIKMLLLLKKGVPSNGTHITAGEKLAVAVQKDFEDRFGPLYNLYGCTELGAIAVAGGDGVLQALEGVEVELRPAEKGQIWCRHNAGFTSYFDREGHPVGTITSMDAWYDTNDIGLPVTQRGFQVIGRSDNCINRYGFLVSLDEIATLLESLFTEINQAIVLETDTEEGLTAKVKAVCELSPGATLDVRAVKKLCQERAARQLIPDEFVFVTEMPRLPNGKPDRVSLHSRYR